MAEPAPPILRSMKYTNPTSSAAVTSVGSQTCQAPGASSHDTLSKPF